MLSRERARKKRLDVVRERPCAKVRRCSGRYYSHLMAS
jgi:hypothetical protein